MMADLRARVIAVLEGAGYKHRENHLPTLHSGGAFSVVGGSRVGVNVTCQLWDAPDGELSALRGHLAEALRRAGFTVAEAGDRLNIPPDERS